jgi:hypothetical protein
MKFAWFFLQQIIIGHNFVIYEWIVFMHGDNNPLDGLVGLIIVICEFFAIILGLNFEINECIVFILVHNPFDKKLKTLNVNFVNFAKIEYSFNLNNYNKTRTPSNSNMTLTLIWHWPLRSNNWNLLKIMGKITHVIKMTCWIILIWPWPLKFNRNKRRKKWKNKIDF